MSTASTIRAKHDLAGKVARAAMDICCTYHKVNKQQKETFTFRDGSQIVITNKRVEVR